MKSPAAPASPQSRFLGAKYSYEDYLAVVADLLESKGYARIVMVAEALGVRSASVTGMIRRLAAKGWVKHEHYRCILLTEEGRIIAASLRSRRQVLMDFFRFLGLSEETAERESHALEHVVSAETLKALARLVRELNGGRSDEAAAIAEMISTPNNRLNGRKPKPTTQRRKNDET